MQATHPQRLMPFAAPREIHRLQGNVWGVRSGVLRRGGCASASLARSPSASGTFLLLLLMFPQTIFSRISLPFTCAATSLLLSSLFDFPPRNYFSPPLHDSYLFPSRLSYRMRAILPLLCLPSHSSSHICFPPSLPPLRCPLLPSYSHLSFPPSSNPAILTAPLLHLSLLPAVAKSTQFLAAVRYRGALRCVYPPPPRLFHAPLNLLPPK